MLVIWAIFTNYMYFQLVLRYNFYVDGGANLLRLEESYVKYLLSVTIFCSVLDSLSA